MAEKHGSEFAVFVTPCGPSWAWRIVNAEAVVIANGVADDGDAALRESNLAINVLEALDRSRRRRQFRDAQVAPN